MRSRRLTPARLLQRVSASRGDVSKAPDSRQKCDSCQKEKSPSLQLASTFAFEELS